MKKRFKLCFWGSINLGIYSIKLKRWALMKSPEIYVRHFPSMWVRIANLLRDNGYMYVITGQQSVCINATSKTYSHLGVFWLIMYLKSIYKIPSIRTEAETLLFWTHYIVYKVNFKYQTRNVNLNSFEIDQLSPTYFVLACTHFNQRVHWKRCTFFFHCIFTVMTKRCDKTSLWTCKSGSFCCIWYTFQSQQVSRVSVSNVYHNVFLSRIMILIMMMFHLMIHSFGIPKTS